MASKHRKTFDAIFATPVRANISWNDAIAMLENAGASVEGIGGSMFKVDLRGIKAVFHKPHPGNELTQARVRAIRTILEQAGVSANDL